MRLLVCLAILTLVSGAPIDDAPQKEAAPEQLAPEAALESPAHEEHAPEAEPEQRAPEAPASEEKAPEALLSEQRAPEAPSSEHIAPELPSSEHRAPEAPASEAKAPGVPLSEQRAPEAPAFESKGPEAPASKPSAPLAHKPGSVSFINPTELTEVFDAFDNLLWALFGEVDEEEYLKLGAAKDAEPSAVKGPIRTGGGSILLMWGDAEEGEDLRLPLPHKEASVRGDPLASSSKEPWNGASVGGSVLMMWGE